MSKSDVISIDFIVPLPETWKRNRVILTVADRLSKMKLLISRKPNVNAFKTAYKLEENIYLNYENPGAIVSDNDQ